MELLLNSLIIVAEKLLLALVVWIAGRIAVRSVIKLLRNGRLLNHVDATAKGFILSFLNGGLFMLLGISVISILGVPMASIITVLASASVAVGLALQGALSNLAGGIMLMLFKPFGKGDYVDAAGVSGTVNELTLFYTVLITVDNKRITVPNGSLMNANIVNYSAEETRRVDMSFTCAKGEDTEAVKKVILAAIEGDERVLTQPSAPFARLNHNTKEALEFAVRVWVKRGDYWDVYHDLTEKITAAMAEAGIQSPAVRILSNR